MIEADLLNLLCCPETRQPLTLLGADALGALNERIQRGSVRNRAGHAVTQRCDGALLREDGKFLYPILGNIPIMLMDEAIPTADAGMGTTSATTS